MKFEKPIIEIKTFDNDEIVTGSGITETDFGKAKSSAQDRYNDSAAETKAIFTIEF